VQHLAAHAAHRFGLKHRGLPCERISRKAAKAQRFLSWRLCVLARDSLTIKPPNRCVFLNPARLAGYVAIGTGIGFP
jgi:hypothetical protein